MKWVLRETSEITACLGPEEKMDLRDLKARWDLRGRPVLVALLERRVNWGCLGCRGTQGVRDQRALMGFLELLELLEKRAKRVPRVNKAVLDREGPTEPEEPGEHEDPRGNLEIRARQGVMDPQDPPEKEDRKDHKGEMGSQDRREQLVQLEKMAFRVTLDNEENRDSKEKQAPRGPLV